MIKITDQQRAVFMLESFSGGFTFALFLRRNMWRYVFLFAGYGVVAAGFWMLDGAFPGLGRMTFAWAVGFACGIFVRDVGWFRAIRAGWPFTKTVTDWNEVQKIADGESARIFE